LKDPAIIVIGASAGGISALSALVKDLPAEIAAAIYVVLHIPPHSPSHLHDILGRCTKLPVSAARDGDPIVAGEIVVAPADRHLMIERNNVRVTRGPKESRVRPAIDVLFRSAAASHGSRVIGVVLTGMLDDGTAGLWAIKDRGGVALIQSPETAEFSSMPESARRHVDVDGALPIEAMATELVRRVDNGVSNEPSSKVPGRMRVENLIAREGNGLEAGVMQIGEVSKYTCPECHGVLVKIEEGTIVRFRCHTGHAYSVRSLLEEVNEAIDTGLWATLRAIEERIMLLKQMQELATRSGALNAAAAAGEQADAASERVETLRKLVLDDKLFGHLPEG
jgi:two-component system, chemotaxis family, protein-glutamate methylesterase/glutaminase